MEDSWIWTYYFVLVLYRVTRFEHQNKFPGMNSNDHVFHRAGSSTILIAMDWPWADKVLWWMLISQKGVPTYYANLSVTSYHHSSNWRAPEKIRPLDMRTTVVSHVIQTGVSYVFKLGRVPTYTDTNKYDFYLFFFFFAWLTTLGLFLFDICAHQRTCLKRWNSSLGLIHESYLDLKWVTALRDQRIETKL